MTEKTQTVPMEKSEARAGAELTTDRPVFTPAADVYEKPDSILVVCDMPGVDEKHVDITLENDVLTLTGHQAADDIPEHQLLRRGYESGVFRRSFTLVADVDRDRIKARITHGVLNVILPKSAAAQPRRIAVESGE